ncbi:unnamed protein product [Rangifer tarandus platyrhynchus]|uniref:Uncharacterized protein n=2 Tax=Rangifer tarandus platyrhynchus TaxID=3082113 RepID=A0ACB0FIM8_RANTA|nr:unnamed protein product [Rangifer tarandus platyrhynchus]CAI9712079.1 unnamed protein product [Rangifer tarandus platyrhynchus]
MLRSRSGSWVGLHGPRTVGAAWGLLCIPGTLHSGLWGTHSGRKGGSQSVTRKVSFRGDSAAGAQGRREHAAGSPSSAEGGEALSPAGCVLGSRPRVTSHTQCCLHAGTATSGLEAHGHGQHQSRGFLAKSPFSHPSHCLVSHMVLPSRTSRQALLSAPSRSPAQWAPVSAYPPGHSEKLHSPWSCEGQLKLGFLISLSAMEQLARIASSAWVDWSWITNGTRLEEVVDSVSEGVPAGKDGPRSKLARLGTPSSGRTRDGKLRTPVVNVVMTPWAQKLSIQGSVQPPKPPAHPPSRGGRLWATPVLSSALSPEPHRNAAPDRGANPAPTSLHTLCAPFTWSVRADETQHRPCAKQPSPHSAGCWESKCNGVAPHATVRDRAHHHEALEAQARGLVLLLRFGFGFSPYADLSSSHLDERLGTGLLGHTASVRLTSAEATGPFSSRAEPPYIRSV